MRIYITLQFCTILSKYYAYCPILLAVPYKEFRIKAVHFYPKTKQTKKKFSFCGFVLHLKPWFSNL